MSDISIRIVGRAGRITLQRPQALNAMTYAMCLAIEEAVDAWRNDPAVALIVLDAEGERAFCSGGDIAELYATGTAGDYAYGQKFWADEYRLNAKLFNYPKPIVSFLQGFTMGGGVGIGCHGSHRVVGDSSQIAMPECGIGLVPDVGGSYILARAPGHLGAYLGTTATRMGPGDAIYAGFADLYLPEDHWPAAITALETDGDVSALLGHPAPAPDLAQDLETVNTLFASADLAEVTAALEADPGPFAAKALKALRRNSPLATACTLRIQERLRSGARMQDALDLEYRFTSRAMEHGDFLEGIRAAIIDKDRAPKWQYADGDVPEQAIATMMTPTDLTDLRLENDA